LGSFGALAARRSISTACPGVLRVQRRRENEQGAEYTPGENHLQIDAKVHEMTDAVYPLPADIFDMSRRDIAQC
jgi:hypothetical protein